MKRLKNKNILFVLGLLIPALLVFKSFFSGSTLVWGDAPFFYTEGLKELIKEPQVWVSRGNNFGGINYLLWLSPVMYIYGLLHKFFSFDNALIIRILFYFPSVILSIIGPIILTKYLGYKKRVQFFSSLLYTLNTYFLLIVDGGQVGVALAYGLFPFTLLFLKKLTDKPNNHSFFKALLIMFVLTMADPRMAIVSFITILLWTRKAFKHLSLLAIALIGLNSYWLVPFIKHGGVSASSLLDSNPMKLANSFFLFQPHWSLNEFGKVFSPPLYYIGLPILIFANWIGNKSKKPVLITTLFLIFAFLLKGNAPPFGAIYDFLVTKVPFGLAFRDSSKFFIPLILFAGILIGLTTEKIKSKLLLTGVYLYILLLIYPALSGDLNFVLSNRTHSEDLGIIKEKLVQEQGFFRTAWFPEKHPVSFHLEDKPALDAKRLIDLRPFSLMNTGSYDVFNYMHNEKFLNFIDILGIRYLVFSGDQRTVVQNEEGRETWDDLLAHVATVEGLEKKDWGIDTLVYEFTNVKPRIYAVDKLIAVVGSDDIYEKPGLELDDIGFMFFEDGKLDPMNLDGLDAGSISILFNNKEKQDMVMSFLQDYYISADEADKLEWANYSSSDYLIWKYQLLIRGLNVKEHTYSLGTTLSTNEGEKLEYNFKTKEDGEYILAIRSLTDSEENILKYEFNEETDNVVSNDIGTFNWFTKEFNLNKGKHQLILENGKGLSSVNIVALIPKEEYEEVLLTTNTYLEHFGTIDIGGVNRLVNQSEWKEIEFEKTSPYRYKIVAPEFSNWIIFTDSHSQEWKLRKGVKYFDSVPVYSMVNAFYTEPTWDDTEIVFNGQKDFRTGLYFSTISILILSITYLWPYPKKR